MIDQCRSRRSAARARASAPLTVLQNFRSVVDDPVARAAPAPADIIEPPDLHRRPEPESDVDQQPYSRLEPVGLRYVLVLIACSGPPARAREGSDHG